MQKLRQLVSGTDFSEHADHALELSLRLAGAAQARVTIVHVCELDADDQRIHASQQALEQLVAARSRPGVEVSGVLRCGTAWQKLDNVAAEVGAGLIVVGRHGAGRGHRLQLGSVAEQLVRSTNRSVLLVACDFDCLVREADANNRE